jgi:hypothetical protein
MRSLGVGVFLAALLLLAACSKEKLGELADKAKQAVAEGADAAREKAAAVTDTAKEQLALAGSCELALDSPLTISACYFSLIPQGSERPAVLQLRSYRDAGPGQESQPSFLLQSQVKAASVSELVGQTVSGQLFVQRASDAPVWFCAPGDQVDLKVISVDGQQMTLEIAGGSLRNSQTSTNQTVTGKIVAVPR